MLEDEITSMESAFNGDSATDAVDSVEQSAPEPVTESTNNDVKEDITEDAAESEQTTTDTPSESATQPDTDTAQEAEIDYKAEYTKIKADLDELKSLIKPKEAQVETQAPTSKEPLDFIGDNDTYDLVNNKDQLNKVLNDVYSKAREDFMKHNESVIRGIPDIVKNNISIMNAMKEAGEKFYSDNPDLIPFKKVVAATFEDVSSKNPDWKYDKVLKTVSVEARKSLDLYKTTVKSNSPKLPNVKGQPRSQMQKPNLDPLVSEIDAMNKTLNF